MEALILRAQLHLNAHEDTDTITDLDAAARAAPKEDYVHLQIGELYVRVAQLGPAIAEYDRWLAAHDQDVHRGTGLRLRCRARALAGQDLDKALSDCNAALRLIAKDSSAPTLQARGLVWLRRGEIDKSLTDFSAALALNPRDYWALYGRGLARLRKGTTADAQADMDAASHMQPRIGEEFAKIGLTP